LKTGEKIENYYTNLVLSSVEKDGWCLRLVISQGLI
jgi:hypothetical protein